MRIAASNILSLSLVFMSGCRSTSGSHLLEQSVGPASVQNLLPLQLNRTWTYKISNAKGSFCQDGQFSMKVTKEEKTKGQTVYAVEGPCGTLGSQFKIDDDKMLISVGGMGWTTFYVSPELNATWTLNGATWRWIRHENSLSILGRTYSDCWVSAMDNNDASRTFCAHVGIVEENNSGGSDHWQLTEASKPVPPAASVENLFPLDSNQTWTYEVSNVTAGYCRPGQFPMKLIEDGQEGGQKLYLADGPCGFSRSFKRDGDSMLINFEGNGWTTFYVKPELNARWNIYGYGWRWIRHEPTLTILDKTYSNCWIAAMGNYATRTFCADVGMVEENNPGGSYLWQLVKKTKSGAARASLQNLLPLKSGKTLTYKVSQALQCNDTVSPMKMRKKEDNQGQAVYEVAGPCNSIRQYKIEGDKMLVNMRNMGWTTFYVKPELNATWTMNGFTWRWVRHEDSLTILGQTYFDCWVSSMGGDTTRTFCSEVGIVEEKNTEGSHLWQLVQDETP